MWKLTGVLAGTLVGERLLLGLSRERFRQIVSIAVGLLGLWFLFRPAWVDFRVASASRLARSDVGAAP